MSPLLVGAAALFCYMCALFVIALIRRDNGIADVGYGIGFIVLSIAVLLASPVLTTFALVLVALVIVWGIRLATRIYRKNHGKPEDFRYKAWRDAWGAWFLPRSFLQVYMLQGLVIFIVALPVTLSLAYPAATATPWLAVLGAALWCIGFFFESRADAELDRFIGALENKGRVMMGGLWKFSRHPNYFGESLMWWGIAIAAAGISAVPLVGFVAPLLITFLLLKVSGVPMLEKRWEGNPEWEAYKARTSVFIPLPPRRS